MLNRLTTLAAILFLTLCLLIGCGGGGGGGDDSSLSKDDLVIMLGDSITRRTDWSSLLPDNTVVNMGVDGDKTGGMLARLGSALAQNPKVLCIMGGINDFRTGFAVSTAYNNLASIVSQARAAGVRVIIQSTLYVGSGYSNAGTINSKVSDLNSRLSSLASSLDQVSFLNLNSSLAPAGSLDYAYSGDGLHLNGTGYSIWAERLKSAL